MSKPYRYFLLTGKMAFLFVHRLIGQRVPFSINLLLCHLKSVSAFCGMLSICVCLWGVFRPVHLPLINWYQKQNALPGITVLFWIRDCDSCIWKWYLECCRHQWNMQFFYFSPHNIWTLGHMFCGTKERFIADLWIRRCFCFFSDIKIPIFVVSCLL